MNRFGRAALFTALAMCFSAPALSGGYDKNKQVRSSDGSTVTTGAAEARTQGAAPHEPGGVGGMSPHIGRSQNQSDTTSAPSADAGTPAHAPGGMGGMSPHIGMSGAQAPAGTAAGTTARTDTTTSSSDAPRAATAPAPQASPSAGYQGSNTAAAAGTLGSAGATTDAGLTASDASRLSGKVDQDASGPPRTGSEIQFGDMGPGSAKAE